MKKDSAPDDIDDDEKVTNRIKEMRALHDSDGWLHLCDLRDEVTTVMAVPDIGCIVKVSKPNCMALVFVPDVTVDEGRSYRELVPIPVDDGGNLPTSQPGGGDATH